MSLKAAGRIDDSRDGANMVLKCGREAPSSVRRSFTHRVEGLRWLKSGPDMSTRRPQHNLYLVRLKYRSLMCKLVHTKIDGNAELYVAQQLVIVMP